MEAKEVGRSTAGARAMIDSDELLHRSEGIRWTVDRSSAVAEAVDKKREMCTG
jgi:hypothetical protein